MKKWIILVALCCAFSGVSAEAAETPAVTEPVVAGESAVIEESVVKPEKKHNVEVQMEYMDHRMFEDREIDTYNVHVYEKFKENGSVSLHKGLTFSRAVGYTTDDGIYRDSNAVGFGPSFMWRWTKPISKKWDASLDGTGSLLAYNKAFPAQGRAFGFMWRIGPRVTYHWNDSNSLSLGYLLMHCSNGFKGNNPGYNGVGFSLGYNHSF